MWLQTSLTYTSALPLYVLLSISLLLLEFSNRIKGRWCQLNVKCCSCSSLELVESCRQFWASTSDLSSQVTCWDSLLWLCLVLEKSWGENYFQTLLLNLFSRSNQSYSFIPSIQVSGDQLSWFGESRAPSVTTVLTGNIFQPALSTLVRWVEPCLVDTVVVGLVPRTQWWSPAFLQL